MNLERDSSKEWKEVDGVWRGSARDVCSRVSLVLLNAVAAMDETLGVSIFL